MLSPAVSWKWPSRAVRRAVIEVQRAAGRRAGGRPIRPAQLLQDRTVVRAGEHDFGRLHAGLPRQFPYTAMAASIVGTAAGGDTGAGAGAGASVAGGGNEGAAVGVAVTVGLAPGLALLARAVVVRGLDEESCELEVQPIKASRHAPVVRGTNRNERMSTSCPVCGVDHPGSAGVTISGQEDEPRRQTSRTSRRRARKCVVFLA